MPIYPISPFVVHMPSLPVARWQGPGVQPPKVKPAPTPGIGKLKTATPLTPSVFQLFEKPRNAGHGDGRL